MTYLSGKSKTKKAYVRYVSLAILFLLVVYYWTAIRAFLYPYVQPVVRGYASTKGAVIVVPSFVSTYVVSHKALAERNEQLEVTIERLENDVAGRDALLREEEYARNSGWPDPSVLVMYPLTEDVTKLYSTVLLSKGYKDGVNQGGVVYVRGMQPVCTVVEVYDRTSLCELLSKGGKTTEAVTASGTIALTLSGMGGGSFTADVPKGTPVTLGDDVYLRSDQALKIGSIVSIKEDDQLTSMKVYVRGVYNPVTSNIFYLSTKYEH